MPDNFNPDQYLANKGVATTSTEVPVDSTQLQQFNPNTYLDQKSNSDFDLLQSKYGSNLQQAEAGAAGIARGATLGLSDLGLVKSGLVDAETLKGLQEANPLSSGAGNVLGGAGLIGTVGGAGTLTKNMGTAAQIAGYGAEGALFGAGNAVSDYALGDPDLNAQKILTHVGLGTALGTGLGILGKTAEFVLPKAYQGLKDSVTKLKDVTTSGQDNLAGIVSENAPSWSEKFMQGVQSAKDPQGKIREFATNLQDLSKNASQAATDMYEKMMPANIAESLENVSPGSVKVVAQGTLDDMTNMYQSVDQNLLSPGFKSTIETTLEKAGNSIDKADSSLNVHEVLSNLATDLDKGKISKYYKQTTMTNPADKELAWILRDKIRGDLKDPSIWGDAATHYGQISDAYSSYLTSLKDFRSSFMKKVAAPFNIKKYSIDPSKVKSFFNNFNDISQDLKKQQLNNFFDQANKISRLSENYSGFQQGADSISSKISDIAKKNEGLSKLAEAISGKKSVSDSLLTAGPLAIGAKILGVPGELVGSILGAVKGYQAIKNPYELGASLGSNFSKLQAVGKILNKVGNKMTEGIDGIFNSSHIRGAVESGAITQDYDKNSQRIKELSQNPQLLYNHLNNTTKNIHEPMPNISSSIQKTLLNSISFLNSKIPRPAQEMPLDSKWEPTNVQKTKFNNYYESALNPLAVLNRISNGNLSNESLEAIQTIHPSLYKELQNKLVANLNSSNISKLNYGQKIAISKFIGQPLSANLQPNIINNNQFALNPPIQSQGQQSSKPRSGRVRDGKLNLGERMNTNIRNSEKPLK